MQFGCPARLYLRLAHIPGQRSDLQMSTDNAERLRIYRRVIGTRKQRACDVRQLHIERRNWAHMTVCPNVVDSDRRKPNAHPTCYERSWTRRCAGWGGRTAAA